MSRDVPADGDALLVFQVGGVDYALAIEQVIEVASMVALMPLPNAPFAVLGMINRRGDPWVLIDLRRVFGCPSLPPQASDMFIVTQHSSERAALLVDHIEGVIHLTTTGLQKSSAVNRYICCIIKEGQRFIQVMTLAPLLADILKESDKPKADSGGSEHTT
jgi:purine-binding chemotaxis protein CheW